MANCENTRKVYLKSTKEWTPVTEEVYREFYREIDTYRKKEQRHGRCACPRSKWWLCDMNCSDCEFHRAGDQLSLDEEMDTGNGSTSLDDILSDNQVDIEEAIILAETYDALHAELEKLDPEGKRICQLIMDGNSERECASVLGMPRSTFKHRLDKLKAHLRSKLADYR